MSWCCLTSGNERSAIKIEGYARNDDAREALSKLRGAFVFYAPHHHSSLLTPTREREVFNRKQGTVRPCTKETLIQSQSQILQEVLCIASS